MTTNEKIDYYRRFSKIQQNRERIYVPKIYKILLGQYQQFSDIVNMGFSPLTASRYINANNFEPVIKELYLDAGKIMANHARATINKLKQKSGSMGFNADMVRQLTEYFQMDILNVCQGITDTTKKIIQEALIKAQEDGMSVNEVVDYIMKNAPEMSRNRARVIARTETVTAANKGAIFAGKDSGLMVRKEWLATLDNRTRRDHAHVNGQVVDIDEYFSVGNGVKMLQPGDRGGKDGNPVVPAKEVVNCRCCVLIEPIRDKNGRLMTV